MISDSWRWGQQYWQPGMSTMATTTSTYNYVKGALAIDVFDTKRKAPVWHSSGSKKLSKEERSITREFIPVAVKTMLADFPVR